MNEQFKKSAAFIVLCGVIAALSCPAAEAFGGIFHDVITFFGDLAVLSMFSLCAPLTAGFLSDTRPESRRAVFCAADCVSLSLKITFAALCALSGSVMLHAAALIVDCVFSRVLFFVRFRDCVSLNSNL